MSRLKRAATVVTCTTFWASISLGAVAVGTAAGQTPSGDISAGLETEEVRPGVRRILTAIDGRELPAVRDIAIDDDGIVWAVTEQGFAGINWDLLEPGWETTRDGLPTSLAGRTDLIDAQIDGTGQILVRGPDAVAWFICSKYPNGKYGPIGEACRGGSAWSMAQSDPLKPRAAHRSADGTLWVAVDAPLASVGRFDGEWAWYTDEDLGIPGIAVSDFAETPDGNIWAGSSEMGRAAGLTRFNGEHWRPEQPFEDGALFIAEQLTIASDGTLWVNLARTDTDDWAGASTTSQGGGPFGPQYLGHYDGAAWTLFEKPLPATGTHGRKIRISPSGVVWFAPGNWAFDGDRWFQPFQEAVCSSPPFGNGAHDIELAPDGSVWVVDIEGRLFVIRPDDVPAHNFEAAEFRGPWCDRLPGDP